MILDQHVAVPERRQRILAEDELLGARAGQKGLAGKCGSAVTGRIAFQNRLAQVP